MGRFLTTGAHCSSVVIALARMIYRSSATYLQPIRTPVQSHGDVTCTQQQAALSKRTVMHCEAISRGARYMLRGLHDFQQMWSSSTRLWAVLFVHSTTQKLPESDNDYLGSPVESRCGPSQQQLQMTMVLAALWRTSQRMQRFGPHSSFSLDHPDGSELCSANANRGS